MSLCLLVALLAPNEIREHEIRSPHQQGVTKIRVLSPIPLKKGQHYPVVYVLPVEAKSNSRYGDGLKEIQRLRLHRKHSAFFVQPTFSHLPWYADHPTNAKIRQETYLLKTVLPFVESRYPVQKKRSGRLLLGFSKSGWGAWCLLLRNPDVFEKAAAWDAPFVMTKMQYGSRPIFGTMQNFEKHRLMPLIRKSKADLNSRLGITGVANFGKHHEAMHAELQRLKIKYFYSSQRKKSHRWESGWLESSVRFLLKTAVQYK